MSADTAAPDAVDDRIDGYVAQKSFLYKGRVFKPGDRITVDVFNHNRFESLLGAGLVRMVKR